MGVECFVSGRCMLCCICGVTKQSVDQMHVLSLLAELVVKSENSNQDRRAGQFARRQVWLHGLMHASTPHHEEDR